MNDWTDQQLLREYAERDAEAAFTELVRRHVDVVHSAAFRMTGEAHSAQDVTQAVFLALAQNAARLAHHPVLSGWLHTTARNLAAKDVRAATRRQNHEQEAATMHSLLANEPGVPWETIAPHLDAALGDLKDIERDAVLLRYFERKSAREMADILGTSEEAVQKRVGRAVEKLRQFFSKRKITIGAGGLTILISANAVQSAPAGLAAMISTSALAGTAVSTATAATTATQTIAVTTLQKVLFTATIATLAAAGMYEGRQAAQLRSQVQEIQRQQAPLAGQIAVLRAENEKFSNQIIRIQEASDLSQAQRGELSQLRRQIPAVQINPGEIARLKATLAEQNSEMPDFLTNAMVATMPAVQKQLKKEAMTQLARMKAKLRFTPDQELAVSNILMLRIERQTQSTLDRIMHRPAPEPPAQARHTDDPDDEIRAMLAPEQLAAYPEYRQQEKRLGADNGAQLEVERLVVDLRLSDEQQEKLKPKLSELTLKNENTDALCRQAAIEASKSGQHAEAIRLVINQRRIQLEEKLNTVGDILTPEQNCAYREEELKMIDMDEAAMKQKVLPKQMAK